MCFAGLKKPKLSSGYVFVCQTPCCCTRSSLYGHIQIQSRDLLKLSLADIASKRLPNLTIGFGTKFNMGDLEEAIRHNERLLDSPHARHFRLP
jgi:hypothetical protein